jgi:hypothetical protein
MISKNIFSRFFSFLAMATILVACSQNDDNATTATPKDTHANRASALNLPHGKLIIQNNTQYTFIDYLYALNILGANPAWLSQKIIINPYTNIQIDNKYSNTTTLGIDYDNNGRWIRTPLNGVSSIIDADAANTYRTTEIYGNALAGYDPYVEWFTFHAASTDGGTVKFNFKVDALTGEIFVNEPYGTFTTTAFVNDSGDIVITLEE